MNEFNAFFAIEVEKEERKKYIEPEERYISNVFAIIENNSNTFLHHYFIQLYLEDAEDFIIEKREEIENQLKQWMYNLEIHLTPDSIDMVTSRGDQITDGGIYNGTAGNL